MKDALLLKESIEKILPNTNIAKQIIAILENFGKRIRKSYKAQFLWILYTTYDLFSIIKIYFILEFLIL